MENKVIHTLKKILVVSMLSYLSCILALVYYCGITGKTAFLESYFSLPLHTPGFIIVTVMLLLPVAILGLIYNFADWIFGNDKNCKT